MTSKHGKSEEQPAESPGGDTLRADALEGKYKAAQAQLHKTVAAFQNGDHHELAAAWQKVADTHPDPASLAHITTLMGRYEALRPFIAALSEAHELGKAHPEQEHHGHSEAQETRRLIHGIWMEIQGELLHSGG